MLLALLVFASPIFAQTAPVKNFRSVLQDVLRAPEYQSTQNDIRAIELDYSSRELVLEPTLEAQAKRNNDERQLLSVPGLTRKPRYDSYGLLLSKPFGTGTRVEVGPSYEHALVPGLNGGERDTVDWHLSLTQSLWKDGFGRSTQLRRAREDFQRKQDLSAALLRQGQMLYDFENLYWDWALARRVFDLQENNVKRGRQILKWVQDRFNRAAAESTDLLQARALLTQRELQVATQQLSLTQMRARIERYVPNHDWRPDPADLEIKRSPEELLAAWAPDKLEGIQSLSYINAENEARAEEEKAKEARESIRPEFNLQLTYGKNAIDGSGNEALKNSYNEDHEYSSVGVVFRSGLDLGNERRKVESARAARDAAQQRREARLAENKVAWPQLMQELKDLEERVGRAKELVDLQIKKADAERERYRKGRSTAFQAITFELEAAEAEITLWSLYALMRKTEARARLFVR